MSAPQHNIAVNMSAPQHNIAESETTYNKTTAGRTMSSITCVTTVVPKLVGPRIIYMQRCYRHTSMGAEYCTLHVAKYAFEYWPSYSERYDKNSSQTFPLR
jgi:hypothetical protein